MFPDLRFRVPYSGVPGLQTANGRQPLWNAAKRGKHNLFILLYAKGNGYLTCMVTCSWVDHLKYFSRWCAIPSTFLSFWYRAWPESVSVARSLLSPSQPIWAERWGGRDASGKCHRPIGLDGVAKLGTALGGWWCRVAVPGTGWYWGGHWGCVCWVPKDRAVMCWGCTSRRAWWTGWGQRNRGRLERWRPCEGQQSGMPILPWGITTTGTSLFWGLPSWKAPCQKRTWVCWWTPSWAQAISVPPWWSKESLELHCQQSEQGVPSTEPWEATAGVVGSALGSEREMGSQEGPQEHLDVGAQAVSWVSSALRRRRDTLPTCTSVGWEEWRQAQTLLSGAQSQSKGQWEIPLKHLKIVFYSEGGQTVAHCLCVPLSLLREASPWR